MMKISIIGVGTFGKAIGTYLKSIGHEIFNDTTSGAEMIFVSTPSHAVMSALLKEEENIFDQPIIICSKGFGEKGNLISKEINGKYKNVFFLYGPTLADELGEGKLSGMVLAGSNMSEGLKIKNKIASKNLQIELSEDIIGVQVGAALKNVVTIFIGVVAGLGYGQNALAYFFTKGLAEIEKFGLNFGAKPETFLGLSCAGDLTLMSRNRKLGLELGKGRILEDIIAETGYAPQGIANLKDAKIIAERNGINLPIVFGLYDILFKKKPAKEIIQGLLE